MQHCRSTSMLTTACLPACLQRRERRYAGHLGNWKCLVIVSLQEERNWSARGQSDCFAARTNRGIRSYGSAHVVLFSAATADFDGFTFTGLFPEVCTCLFTLTVLVTWCGFCADKPCMGHTGQPSLPLELPRERGLRVLRRPVQHYYRCGVNQAKTGNIP